MLPCSKGIPYPMIKKKYCLIPSHDQEFTEIFKAVKKSLQAVVCFEEKKEARKHFLFFLRNPFCCVENRKTHSQVGE